MENVNWKLLSDAVVFYQTHGFKYVETPWIAHIEDLMVTAPSRNKIFLIDDSYDSVAADDGLVGSAEQAFISMARAGTLPDGVNFVSCGPCFRKNEPKDKWHMSQFMKVELFVRLESDANGEFVTNELVNRAKKFMDRYNEVQVETTEEGKDLVLNGVEVGSYGYRHAEGVGWWAYGTGLALPRFTQAANRIEDI